MTAAPPPVCLSQALVDYLAAHASTDARFQAKAFGLHLTFGLRDVQSNTCVWLRVEGTQVHGGTGEADTRFTLAGETEAWQALCTGFPINRLVRQGRIRITGDARCCIQNWLVVYFLTAGATGFGG